MGRHAYVVGVWPMIALWVIVLAAIGVLIFLVVRLAQERSHAALEAPTGPALTGPAPVGAVGVGPAGPGPVGGPHTTPAASADPAPASSPRLILEERFARGEIDADDFRERLRVLDEA